MNHLARIQTPPPGAYFLTQTLKPAYYKLNARRQIKETKSHLKRMLNRYSDLWEFTIELTKSANIHYHSWLILRADNELNKLCLLDDLKILGNSRLEVIKRHEDVRNYLMKDLDTTDKLLNYTRLGKSKNPIIKIIYNSDGKKGTGGGPGPPPVPFFASVESYFGHPESSDEPLNNHCILDLDDEYIYSNLNMQIK